MKNIQLFKTVLTIAASIILFALVIGCGSDVNEDFEGFGGSGSYHPFESLAVDNHGNYLVTAGYDFTQCTECHGEELKEEGKSCFSCHNEDSHPGLMGNVEAEEEHDDYFRAAGWNIGECEGCHWLYYVPEMPSVEFGGICSTGGCHDAANRGPQKCTTCHGEFAGDYSDTTTWAPPAALDNSLTTDNIGVGAHQAHLNSQGIWAQVECVTCHNVPTAWDDTGHIDSGLPAEADVVFHPVGSNDTGTHSWDHDEGECNAYCHFDAEPEWTEVNDTWNQCGTCHALPPTDDQSPNHPSASSCSVCHGNVDAGLNIIDPALHANGEVD